MRLLLVEDDRSLRGFLRKAFREEGYTVDTAESGDQAVERALTGDYHCVVLDVMLPGRDGSPWSRSFACGTSRRPSSC